MLLHHVALIVFKNIFLCANIVWYHSTFNCRYLYRNIYTICYQARVQGGGPKGLGPPLEIEKQKKKKKKKKIHQSKF